MHAREESLRRDRECVSARNTDCDATDIGQETGTPVAADTTVERSRFNGVIRWVQIDVGLDDKDHYISPEERYRLAMARQ